MHRTARERLDLVDNEGEERSDDNRQAGRDERGKVEAAALAGSSGHHHEHIATAHRRVDRPQLERPQRAVAKDGAIRERELGRPRKAVAVKSGGRHVVLVVHRVVRVRRARFRIGSGQQQLWLWWWGSAAPRGATAGWVAGRRPARFYSPTPATRFYSLEAETRGRAAARTGSAADCGQWMGRATTAAACWPLVASVWRR